MILYRRFDSSIQFSKHCLEDVVRTRTSLLYQPLEVLFLIVRSHFEREVYLNLTQINNSFLGRNEDFYCKKDINEITLMGEKKTLSIEMNYFNVCWL